MLVMPVAATPGGRDEVEHFSMLWFGLRDGSSTECRQRTVEYLRWLCARPPVIECIHVPTRHFVQGTAEELAAGTAMGGCLVLQSTAASAA